MSDLFVPYQQKGLTPHCLIVDESAETVLTHATASETVRVIDASNHVREAHGPQLLIRRTTKTQDVADTVAHCTAEEYKGLLFIAGLSETQTKGAGLEQATRTVISAVRSHTGPIVFLERAHLLTNPTYEAIFAYVAWAYRVHSMPETPYETLREPARHQTNAKATRVLKSLIPTEAAFVQNAVPTEEHLAPEDSLPPEIEKGTVEELLFLIDIRDKITGINDGSRLHKFMIKENIWPSSTSVHEPNPQTTPEQMREACIKARKSIAEARKEKRSTPST